MNTFKRNRLYLVVQSALGSFGQAGVAEAVHINFDGLDDGPFIYPYCSPSVYQSSLVSYVINKNSGTKMAKVRFLEGRNSQEVIDFNLFLSPQDVWTGAVVANVQPAVHDLPMAILTSKDISKIDQYTHAFNVTKDITPILVLSNPREEAKMPTEEEISNLIKGKTLEGYFPI